MKVQRMKVIMQYVTTHKIYSHKMKVKRMILILLNIAMFTI